MLFRSFTLVGRGNSVAGVRLITLLEFLELDTATVPDNKHTAVSRYGPDALV